MATEFKDCEGNSHTIRLDIGTLVGLEETLKFRLVGGTDVTGKTFMDALQHDDILLADIMSVLLKHEISEENIDRKIWVMGVDIRNIPLYRQALTEEIINFFQLTGREEMASGLKLQMEVDKKTREKVLQDNMNASVEEMVAENILRLQAMSELTQDL